MTDAKDPRPIDPEIDGAPEHGDDGIPYRAELVRKAIHLMSLVVPLFMWTVGKWSSIYVLVPAAVLALVADWLRVRSHAFARFIYAIFGFMMRYEERPPVGGAVVVNGATWVLMSAALLALLFPIRIAVAVFVMFMISDAAAALVGRRYGRHHWGSWPRTIEGSVAFVLTGTLIMSLFTGIAFWIGLVAVLLGAAAEILVDYGQSADMIVVGSRGLGSFRGMILGSVSHKVATHATCPVVVMPAHAER